MTRRLPLLNVKSCIKMGFKDIFLVRFKCDFGLGEGPLYHTTHA